MGIAAASSNIVDVFLMEGSLQGCNEIVCWLLRSNFRKLWILRMDALETLILTRRPSMAAKKKAKKATKKKATKKKKK